MHTLDFSLHEFKRLTWVSREMQERWQPRFDSMAQRLAPLQRLTLFPKIYPVQLLKVYPHEFDALAAWAIGAGLAAEALEIADDQLAAFFLEFELDDRKIAALLGRPEKFAPVHKALAGTGTAALHRALGTSACCCRFIDGLKARGLEESIWPMTAGGEDTTASRVSGHCETNPLLAKLGINLLNHRPCRPDCEDSIAMASGLVAYAREAGDAQLIDEVIEVLSWSYGWSTLHGIAELKSPLFKLIYNSQACAVKYAVEWHGTRHPDTGLAGVGFPYQQPEHRSTSGSAGFERGLANPIA